MKRWHIAAKLFTPRANWLRWRHRARCFGRGVWYVYHPLSQEFLRGTRGRQFNALPLGFDGPQCRVRVLICQKKNSNKQQKTT